MLHPKAQNKVHARRGWGGEHGPDRKARRSPAHQGSRGEARSQTRLILLLPTHSARETRAKNISVAVSAEPHKTTITTETIITIVHAASDGFVILDVGQRRAVK